MFPELFSKRSNFRKKYLPSLVSRFSAASLQMEETNCDLSDFSFAFNLYNQTEALNRALDLRNNHKLNFDDIIEIEKILTDECYTGFRRTRAEVYGSNIKRSLPYMIPSDLSYLLDNYYNVWNELDPYEREALFHIRFLHIHPFEDGNGRTARVILFRNLCVNSTIPCVITKNVKTEYCQYIENSDVSGLTNLFKRLADNELEIMIAIYRSLDSKGLLQENNMNELQLQKYEIIKHNLDSQDSSDTLLRNYELENKLYSKKYPFRNVYNLNCLFDHGCLPNEYNFSYSKEVSNPYMVFVDSNSKDKAIYNDVCKMLNIIIKNDERVFKIYQFGSDMRYEIDGVCVLRDEFNYELQNDELRNSRKKVKVKKL